MAGEALADAGACLAAALPGGDPSRVRLAALRSAALGTELRSAASTLLDASGSTVWHGVAQHSFATAIAHNAPRLSATADRYEAYSVALSEYAGHLDTALSALPGLSRVIGYSRDELVALRSTPVDDSPRGAAQLRRMAQVEVDLRALVSRFAQAQSAWIDAVARCHDALLHANEIDPTRDLHGWAAVRHNVGRAAGGVVRPFAEFVEHPSLHALSEACGSLASDLAVLGLALMVVCPPAAAICFTAATIMSAAKLGADVGRMTNGEGIGAAAIIGDLVDSLPGGRGLREVERAVPHGFESVEEFSKFGSHLNAGLREAGHPEARAAFQGSAVTGRKFTTGEPFDVGRRSDFDIALSGERLLAASRDAGLKLRSKGLRTEPLNDRHLAKLGLLDLRDRLEHIADRDVAFMVYRTDEDVLRRPTIWVPKS